MATLTINGRIRDVQAEADTPLLWVIREQVGLTGTKPPSRSKPVRSLPLKNVKLA